MEYRLLVVEPNKQGYEMEFTFDEAVNFIGNFVQYVHLYDDKYAVLDEEGYIKQLEPNRTLIIQERGYEPLFIVGKMLVVKVDMSGTGEWLSMSDEEINEAEFIFRNYNKDATIFI